jgi:hypothetical protein
MDEGGPDMADAILIRSAEEPPPLDTVLLWLTNTVERDFEERGVFPTLRQARAKAFRGAATLHYLTTVEAGQVLEDAKARERLVRRGTRNAYTAHIKSVQAAIREAAERPAVFGASEPVCTYNADHAERWRGTKDQLRAKGIELDGPWPREPGGKERWAQTRDSRGYKTSITRFSAVWPGLYEAHITIPYEVWSPRRTEKPKESEADRASRNLALMLSSADDFRADLVDWLRTTVNIALERALAPATWHGYTLDQDAVGEIHASFDAVAEAVAAARINFDQVRHNEIAQRYRAAIARADTAFQSRLVSLVEASPNSADGGEQ